jgi:hypothetical protein
MRPKPWIGEVCLRPATLMLRAPGAASDTFRRSIGCAHAAASRLSGWLAAQGDRHRKAALRNNLADTLHRAGRDDEAMEELKRAVAIFAEVGGHEEEPQPGVWRLVEW